MFEVVVDTGTSSWRSRRPEQASCHPVHTTPYLVLFGARFWECGVQIESDEMEFWVLRVFFGCFHANYGFALLVCTSFHTSPRYNYLPFTQLASTTTGRRKPLAECKVEGVCRVNTRYSVSSLFSSRYYYYITTAKAN
jgi:hypothetical protein